MVLAVIHTDFLRAESLLQRLTKEEKERRGREVVEARDQAFQRAYEREKAGRAKRYRTAQYMGNTVGKDLIDPMGTVGEKYFTAEKKGN